MPTRREHESAGEKPREENMESSASAMPGLEPPKKMSGGKLATGESRPTEVPQKGGMLAGSTTAPTQPPPTGLQAGGGVGAWNSDKRVQGLWSINQDRNSWVYLSDVGWKKLANSSDTSIVAMTALAAHARQMQSRIDTREEADGMIYEIYVW